MRELRRRTLALGAPLAVVVAPWVAARAEEETAGYAIELTDLIAKVGEPTVWRATLRPRPGIAILHGYSNRVGQLSSYDDGVEFERKMFPGVDEDGLMVFDIRLRATKPGTHPVNGVFRVGYVEKPDYMAMVSLPLIAKVIASE